MYDFLLTLMSARCSLCGMERHQALAKLQTFWVFIKIDIFIFPISRQIVHCVAAV